MPRIACLVAALALTSGTVCAQQGELDRILERDRIAIQKLTADVNKALAQARALERTDSAGAAEALADAVSRVKSAVDLPGEERARLLQRLQAAQRSATAAAQVKRAADDDAARRANDRQRPPREEFTGSRPPVPATGPAAIAGNVVESRNAQISGSKTRRDQQAQAANDVLSGLQRSATPIQGNVEFPKDWDRITARSKPKLTEREIALLQALNSTLSVNFDKTRFRDALDFIQEKAGLTLFLEEASMKDASVDYDDPVTFKVSKANVRTILRKVLADRGLAYIIKEGSLHVVTTQKARETMVVRAYPISDLLGTENRYVWGPIWKRAFELQHAQTIVNMVQGSLEPGLWNSNGGPGSVTFHEPTQSLVIRAPAEFHYQLGSGGLLGR